VRLTVWVVGRVQGVGFRWWVRSTALELGLAGLAENLADGRVKVVAEGAEDDCRELLARLGNGPIGASPGGSGRAFGGRRLAPPGRVTQVTHRWAEATGTMSGFTER
jgi:acylphosphatase